MPIDFDKARVRLDELLKACTVCGRREWVLVPTCHAVPGLDIDRKVIQFSGRVLTLISVQCAGCGQVLFFNPIALGVVMPVPGPPQSEEAKPA